MTYNQLQSFLAAADSLSFTQAAQMLYTTQQNVSNQILNLEQELDCPLFLRSSRGLTLTAQGELYRTLFGQQLSEGKRLLSEIAADKRMHDGLLRVGISLWLDPTDELLFGSLSAFCRQHPEIALTASRAHNRSLLSGLKHHSLDVVLLSDARPLGDPVVVCRSFASQDICLYVPEEYADREPDPGCWGLPLLYGENWDFGRFEWKRVLERRLSSAGLSPSAARGVASLESLRMQLMTTRCCALVENQMALGDRIPGYAHIPLEKSSCYCIRHCDNGSRSAEAFFRFLAEYYRDRDNVRPIDETDR